MIQNSIKPVPLIASDKRINSLIDDANNSLKKSGHQIVYERDGGDSFNLYFR